MVVMASAIPTAVGAAQLRFTTRADGDFHADLVAPEELRRRQRAVVDLPWTFLDEVHGVEVVTVREPGQHTGARADAAVTDRAGAVLGIWVGDCAPVALVAAGGRDRRRPRRVARVSGRRAARHRRGHAPARRDRGGGPRRAVHRARVLRVRRRRPRRPPAALRARRSWPPRPRARPRSTWWRSWPRAWPRSTCRSTSTGPCTACDDRYWSHRARGDLGRQAMAVWLERAS